MTKANQANITVDGGYAPQTIHLQQKQPATLTFTRRSDQGCLGQVHSQALDFAKDLPLNQPVTVNVPTDKTGEFDFSCGMDMFHGKVVIDK